MENPDYYSQEAYVRPGLLLYADDVVGMLSEGGDKEKRASGM